MPGRMTRQFWLWVTRPRWYLDEDGQDREDLDPAYGPTNDWWTFDGDTREGDLAFLWRTSPKSDIGYLMRANSDAYPVPEDWETAHPEWPWRCDYRVLYKFGQPVTIADLRREPRIESWSALRSNFQRMVFPIPIEHWHSLNVLCIRTNPSYRQVLRRLGFSYPLEDAAALTSAGLRPAREQGESSAHGAR
jgi:predicted RNA-binding protein with PUA-like domain